MKIFNILGACTVSIFILFGTLLASDYGTADEAKAMLEKASLALSKDNKQALADFTAGKEPYKMKDLYVFCFDMDSEKLVAHGMRDSLIGYDVNEMQDKTGKMYGKELIKNAIEGEYRQVTYYWPRPNEEEPSPKTSYITRVGNTACGVGYYK